MAVLARSVSEGVFHAQFALLRDVNSQHTSAKRKRVEPGERCSEPSLAEPVTPSNDGQVTARGVPTAILENSRPIWNVNDNYL